MSGSLGSISASIIVNVQPSVISAAGSALALNGLILTNGLRTPIGTVPSFPTATAVGNYYGFTSTEYNLAVVYFGGFVNSNLKPGALYFAQYPWTGPVAAFLRGSSLASVTLAQLQAFAGTLTVTINGTPVTSSAISLAAATSFSNAATIIATALGTTGATYGVTSSATTIVGTTMTVAGMTSGAIASGNVLTGTGVTAGTTVSQQLTGTPGGVGTYTVSISQTVSATAITAALPAVSYDSILSAFVVNSSTTGSASTIGYGSGTIAASLGLTQASGAVLSQGAALAVPGTFMAGVLAVQTNWYSFATVFEPVIADKVSFSSWANSTNNTYAYSLWDTNAANIGSNPTGTAVQTINTAGYSGTIITYSDINAAVGAMGAVASINYNQKNGAITLMGKQFSGVTPSVYNTTSAQNLTTNGLNYYGQFANQANNFTFYENGQITGPYKFVDAHANQVQLTNALQTALLNLLTTVFSVPYNTVGYNLIAAACQAPILAAVNFGSISPGVALSPLQIAEVNNAAGLAIDGMLSTRGWYLQILPASAASRAARTTPPITLWYMYAGSVQQINLASILVQ